MTCDRDSLLRALEHPRRDADAAKDPALTAAVMSRVRALPTAAQRRRARAQWLVAGVVAVALCLVPYDRLVSGLPDDLGGDLRGEGAVAVGLAVAVAAAVAWRRRGHVA